MKPSIRKEVGHGFRRLFLVQFEDDFAHAGIDGHLRRIVRHHCMAQCQAAENGQKAGEQRDTEHFRFLHGGFLGSKCLM
jgi:hypothetical protein